MKDKFKHYDWKIAYDIVKSLMPFQRMLDVGCGNGKKQKYLKI